MNQNLDSSADTPAELAKKFASEAYSAASDNVKERLDEKVQSGAAYLDNVASALHRTAKDLAEGAPLASNVAEFCAAKVEDWSEQIEGKSATELLDVAKDFARRQPVLVVAAAAAAGFMAFRAFKNASPVRADYVENDVDE